MADLYRSDAGTMSREEGAQLGGSRKHVGTDSGSSGGGGPASALERWLLKKMLEALGGPTVRLVLWDGQVVDGGRGAARFRLHIRDRWALYRLVFHPDLEFGELYSAGRLEVDGDLAAFLDVVNRARSEAGRAGVKEGLLEWFYRPRSNTVARSRDNIYHHYDIGNDFYRLWLDEQMLYTCAYFPTRDLSIEAAQIAKMDHVCRKLQLQPGQTVVEAGCGWGALARHMARHYGVSVKAYNISKEQLAYARERTAAEGLEDRVEFIEGDYREIRGDFDAFVSVGMLEHVGVDHYAQLGQVIDHAIKDTGRGLIHTIGRNRPGMMNAWIEKRIFPGACPPSLGQMMRIFEPSNFSVLDVENLRLHYALTLEHWLERYEHHADRVLEMFDQPFYRAWRLYLAGSVAAFRSGDLQLFQVVFARYGDNTVPWTREHLYAGAAHGQV